MLNINVEKNGTEVIVYIEGRDGLQIRPRRLLRKFQKMLTEQTK